VLTPATNRHRADARRITTTEMRYMRKQQDTLGQIIKQRDCKKKNKTTVLYKMQEYSRDRLQHTKRMTGNRLQRILKSYRPTDRRNQGRPLNILLDV
jgi:hypothetical protein